MLAIHAASPTASRAFRATLISSPKAAAQGDKIHVARETEIFGQEAPARRIYRIVHGAVRTVRLLSDGRRQIGAFYFPGDWIGLEAGPVHSFGAEAVSDVALVAYDRVATLSLGKHPELGAELVAAMVKELSRANDHRMLLGRKTAEERVATFLLDLDDRGVQDLPMRRQDIADYLGLTIETVSRMLTQLQHAGVVRICNTRHLDVLDREELELLAA